jgi:hypothetical protein
MNFTKALRLSILAGVLVATAPGQTQAPDPPADPPAWTAGPINFSGLVDGYYSLNFQHPASGTNVLRNFDVRANSFSLNMAKLTMKHDADPIGFTLDLAFGRAMEIFHATEPFQNGTGVMRNIFQAYVSVKPENAGGFQFDFGKFATSAGAEPTETHLNWNYSRAYLYANGPYYHFGARISKPITSFWTAGVQLVNGWNNVEDNNGGKTVGLTSALTSKKVSLFTNYYTGPEKARGLEGNRHFIDNVLLLTPHDKASFYINYDYGVDKAPSQFGGNKNWWGIALAGHFQLNDCFSISPRYETYNDIDGFITGVSQKLQEFTITGEAKMAKGFLTRVEYRRDWSDQPYFDRGNEPGSSKNQDTVLVGFVVYFGK